MNAKCSNIEGDQVFDMSKESLTKKRTHPYRSSIYNDDGLAISNLTLTSFSFLDVSLDLNAGRSSTRRLDAFTGAHPHSVQ